MHWLKVAAATLVLSFLAGGLANAGSGNGVTAPAEYPPAGYTGKQYVDSRGCVYARVSVNGRTGWVARAGPDHRQLCQRRKAAVVSARKRLSAVAARKSRAGSAAFNAKYLLPGGYERAWKDGRLNPDRGPRTTQGDAQMDRIWTRTVPRRLIVHRKR